MWLLRGVVWTLWGANAALSLVYCIIAAVSYSNVNKLYKKLGSQENKELNHSKISMMGIQSAYVLGIIIITAYTSYSFLILMRRWFAQSRLAGLKHGIIVTSSVCTSMFMLLSALTLHSHETQIHGGLNDEHINTYQASFLFAYVLTGTYMVIFVALIFSESAFTSEGSAAALDVE
ncbi:hypothetical protein BSKO_00882 [Bryopsis sp. KO-2023]|nr:hypothetical protein BSKO_00882 [Bryopsis sp. KO-2023]